MFIYLVGNFGRGKTEIAVMCFTQWCTNLSRTYRNKNPYFEITSVNLLYFRYDIPYFFLVLLDQQKKIQGYLEIRYTIISSYKTDFLH